MRHAVIQSVQGAEPELPMTSKSISFDYGNSQIAAGSVYAQFINGKKQAHTAPSKDKLVIGYLPNGLPFMIIVDGFMHTNADDLFAAIDNHVVPLAGKYSEQIESKKKSVADYIDELIQEIFTRRRDHFPQCEFKMSMAIGYKDRDQSKLAGFGLGSTGIALQRHNQQDIETLIGSIGTDKNLAFYKTTDSTLNPVTRSHTRGSTPPSINKNFFDTTIAPGDEIVGYTHLMDKLFDEHQSTFSIQDQESSTTPKRKLKQEILFYDESSLLRAIMAMNKEKFEAKTNMALNGTSITFGGECTIGSVKVPDAKLTRKLELLFAYPKEADDSNDNDDETQPSDNNDKEIYTDSCEEIKRAENLPKTKRDRFVEAANEIQQASPNQIPPPALTSTVVAVEYAALYPHNQANNLRLATTARTASGKPSLLWRVLGATLMALGTVLTGVGALGIAGSLASGIFAPGVIPAAGMLTAGIALTATGASLFRYGKKPAELRKSCKRLAKELINPTEELTSSTP